MTMKMMKEMKWKRQEKKMIDRITWGSERQCRDMRRHLLVIDNFFFFFQSNLLNIFTFCLAVLWTLSMDWMTFSEFNHIWKYFWMLGLTSSRFMFAFSEPVNRKQSNPSLFDTHRSPARRSHIRLVEICRKIPVKSVAKCFTMCDSLSNVLLPWLMNSQLWL